LNLHPSTNQEVADVFHVERIRPVVCTLRPSGRGQVDVRKVMKWRGRIRESLLYLISSGRLFSDAGDEPNDENGENDDDGD
jgi:hypothetical protein